MSSLRTRVKAMAIKSVNVLGISSKYIGSPKRILTTKDWIQQAGHKYRAQFIPLFPLKKIKEKPPVTLENEVHPIFSNEYGHETIPGFVAVIPNGRVWGRNGTVITPDDVLLSDVSREFGAYGGVMGQAHSVNKQLYLHNCRTIKGTVAILGTAGTYNYHHWLYDTLCRVYILKCAGLFNQIDAFIFDYNGVGFQKESLRQVGIPAEKIISSTDDWKFHIEAETLIIPSLPSRLGRVSEWPAEFLRNTFLVSKHHVSQRLYISRRKAKSRKIINEDEVFSFLQSQGFIEFFPEDHMIVETASRFASANFIVGVHGSGFANLAFISAGTKVIDIVAPRHLDPYYWMLTNRNKGNYAYLFGEGDRVNGQVDLVKSKIDHDIYVDLTKLKTLFKLL